MSAEEVPNSRRAGPSALSDPLKAIRDHLERLKAQQHAELPKPAEKEVTPDNAADALECLMIESLDLQPQSVLDVLTRRRPGLAAFGSAIGDIWDMEETGLGCLHWTDDNCIMLYRILFSGRRSATVRLHCTLATEVALAGNDFAYHTRVQLFDQWEVSSVATNCFLGWCGMFGLLGFTDDVIVGRPDYAPNSRVSVASLVADRRRQRPVFVLPRTAVDTRGDREVRRALVEILQPWGHVASLKRSDIDRLPATISGIEPSSGFLKIDPAPVDANLPQAWWMEYVPLDTASTRADLAVSVPNLGISQYTRAAARPWEDGVITLPIGEQPVGAQSRIVYEGDPRTGLIRLKPSSKKAGPAVRELLNEPGWDHFSPPLPPPPEHLEQSEVPATPIEITEPSLPRITHVEPQPRRRVAELNDLRDFPHWLHNLPRDRIIVLRRAIREAKSTIHPEPRRIAAALTLLARLRWASFQGDRTAALQFEAELQQLHLHDGFTNAERLKGLTGKDYEVVFDGRKLLLDRKIASNSSGFNDPKMIRIYYCHDRESGKLIVGWLPTHLRTLSS
jgi:hypothetical protein